MDEKKWYMSKGILGSLVAIAAGIAGSAGYAFSPEEVAQGSNLLYGLVTTVAGVVSFIGRIKAKTKIK